LIGYNLYEQLKFSLRKNLGWYSPIKAWFVITWVALIHSRFECLKCLIYGPSLIYEGLILWRSSSRRSRKWLSLRSDVWNVIYQFFMTLLLSSFLSRSHNTLEGNRGVRLNFFISLSTNTWWGQFASLKQSQNLIELDNCLLKNNLRSFNIAINCH